jgi:hypothetical protein
MNVTEIAVSRIVTRVCVEQELNCPDYKTLIAYLTGRQSVQTQRISWKELEYRLWYAMEQLDADQTEVTLEWIRPYFDD